jgi:hypothetical protein
MGFGGIRKLAAISGMTTRPDGSMIGGRPAGGHVSIDGTAQPSLRCVHSCFAGPRLTADTRVNGKGLRQQVAPGGGDVPDLIVEIARSGHMDDY